MSLKIAYHIEYIPVSKSFRITDFTLPCKSKFIATPAPPANGSQYGISVNPFNSIVCHTNSASADLPPGYLNGVYTLAMTIHPSIIIFWPFHASKSCIIKFFINGQWLNFSQFWFLYYTIPP